MLQIISFSSVSSIIFVFNENKEKSLCILLISGNPSNFRIENNRVLFVMLLLIILPTSGFLDSSRMVDIFLALVEVTGKRICFFYSLYGPFLNFCYREESHRQGFSCQASEC